MIDASTIKNARILIVDDAEANIALLERTLKEAGYRAIDTTQDPREAASLYETNPYDLVLLDLIMPAMDGFQVLEKLKRLEPDGYAPVLVITAEPGHKLQALKAGAKDFVSKPLDLAEVVTRVYNMLEVRLLHQETRRLYLQVLAEKELGQKLELELQEAMVRVAKDCDEPLGIVAKSTTMQRLVDLTRRVAKVDSTILITGESGSGKERIARLLHAESTRAAGPFLAVNCGAIAETLLESELFGHEKGAFTGAIAARRGRFELAQGGTLFLDEIGDMPLPMQVKLLRVLQERLFDRVGGGKPIQADVRIIAATHRDLEAMIRTQGFREDLYYRLNVFPIETPPLRDRADDIPLLLQELLNRHAELHQGMIRLTQRAMESLMQYPWPGNVRELSNLLERLLILYPQQIVDVADLPSRYRLLPCEPRDERLTEMDERDALAAVFQDPPELDLPASHTRAMQLPEEGVNLKEMLADLEVELIRQALESQDGVVARAADLLGMRRTTLVEKMKKYGMSKEA